ncbi:glycine betaine ABC transporter substrate-binding protein [Lichenicoccus sp.]|uniref:glycine betaine ABC transporter substrate-binding protein n=1 Tax=Lichenicoccus sp. TaxID=2781899 RepID=UPI003D0FAFDF
MDPLRLGFPATALHEAAAAAVARVLEAHDHEVEAIALPPGAPRDGIDLFVAAWLAPGEAMSDLMQPIGLVYRPSLIWCVLADAPKRIDELAACPELDRRIVVPANTQVADAAARVRDAYDLAGSGYVIDPLPEAQAFAWAQAADHTHVVPLTRPHELLHTGPWRVLLDPLVALGVEQQACILLRAGLRETLDRDLIDELDELTLGNKVVSAMAHAIRLDGMSAEAAADAWQRGKLTPRG